MMNTLWYTVCS